VLGTAASRAMQGLAQHDGVSLIDEPSPSAIAEAVNTIASRPRPPAVIPDWGAATRTFLAGLR
jgi:hypothetical protein